MMKKDRIVEVLTRAGLVDALQLRSAQAQLSKWGGRLPHVVVELGFADEDAVMDALAQAFNLPVTHLANLPKDPMALARVPEALATEKGVFPLRLKDGGRLLVLAMADPSDLETIDHLSHAANCRVQPVLASEADIQRSIARHYRNENPPPRATTRRLTGSAPSAPVAHDDAPPLPPVPNLDVAERIRQLQSNQVRTTQILRVLRELLETKGVLR